jgi:hypothetical protein
MLTLDMARLATWRLSVRVVNAILHAVTRGSRFEGRPLSIISEQNETFLFFFAVIGF